MPYFLIGDLLSADGPLYVLWARDASGVWVLPWGSRDRRDMQAVGRSLAELGTLGLGGDPTKQAAVIVAGAVRHAAGRRLGLVDLDEAVQDVIAGIISSELGADRPPGRIPQPALDREVLDLVGQRLAAIS